jgi:hypothetical protein
MSILEGIGITIAMGIAGVILFYGCLEFGWWLGYGRHHSKR